VVNGAGEEHLQRAALSHLFAPPSPLLLAETWSVRTLSWGVPCRDEAILTWRSLAAMRRLRLAGNFYLSEVALAAVLAAMPRLQHLRLEHVQGGGGAVLAPLAGMPELSCLELASCHLTDGPGMQAALRGATGLAHLRVQVRSVPARWRRRRQVAARLFACVDVSCLTTAPPAPSRSFVAFRAR
jgi:hypothetical protein